MSVRPWRSPLVWSIVIHSVALSLLAGGLPASRGGISPPARGGSIEARLSPPGEAAMRYAARSVSSAKSVSGLKSVTQGAGRAPNRPASAFLPGAPAIAAALGRAPGKESLSQSTAEEGVLSFDDELKYRLALARAMRPFKGELAAAGRTRQGAQSVELILSPTDLAGRPRVALSTSSGNGHLDSTAARLLAKAAEQALPPQQAVRNAFSLPVALFYDPASD